MTVSKLAASLSFALSLHVLAAPQMVIESPPGTQLASNSAALDLGTGVVGSTANKLLTIRNTGDADLALTSITLSGGDLFEFGQALQGSPVVTPGGSIILALSFTPTSSGSKSCNFSITSTDPLQANWENTLEGVALVPAEIAQQAYLKASNTGAYDRFGYSVAIDGDTMVVGAPYENSNATGIDGNQADDSAQVSGAAYVFVRNGTTWVQQAYLKASNTETSDLFGYSVAIDGDIVVVGAIYEDSNATGINGNQADNSSPSSGAAYVFVRSGTTWSQQAYLKASNTGANDNFGYSVAVDGDSVLVGARREASNTTGIDGNQADNSLAYAGAAYVFTRSGTTWSQQAYLKASNTEGGDYFGTSVAIDGDTVLVGAFAEDSNATGIDGNQADNTGQLSGAAYVFVRSGTTWSQQAYLKASNTGSGDYFGNSVAIDGDTVLVGASGEDSNASGIDGNQADNSAANSGAAYVFVRNGTTWSQQAYLKASNPGTDDRFAESVALHGDTVLAGAFGEASNATGINGNQADNSVVYAGAAYVFTRSGTTWVQQTYLKASNNEASDNFASSVALHGDTVVVSSREEDSGATGIDGDQADNSALSSGAAYVFTIVAATSPEIAVEYPVDSDLTDGAAALAFGDSAIGAGVPLGLTIRNTGTATLDLGAISIDGTDAGSFSAGIPASAALAPGELTTLELTFTPASIGAKNATLHIASNDTDENPFDISLGGTGVVGAPEIAIEAPPGKDWSDGGGPLDFGGGLSGITGIRTLTIRNTGNAELTLGTPTIDGPEAADFIAAMPASAAVAAGSSTTLEISFTPSASGAMSATLHIPSDDGDEASFDLTLAGRGFVPGEIAEQAYLKAALPGFDDKFGFAVAIDADTLVVGAPYEDSSSSGIDGDPADDNLSNSGAAYVFARNGPTWEQQAYLKASNPGVNHNFGISVAVSGDTVAIGAFGEDGNAGATYVFLRNGESWTQQAYLKASNSAADDQFGGDVALDGETLVVGAKGEDSAATGSGGDQANNSLAGAGAAYVFVRSGTTWTQEAYLKASNPGQTDSFGQAVGISGETLVIGAYYEDSGATGINGDQADNTLINPGAAYVFVRDSGSWSQQAYLKVSNTGGGDAFGFDVAIDGELVAVSASYEDSNASGVNGNAADNNLFNSGAAYVFGRSGTAWAQLAYLKASNPGASDRFGTSIDVDDNRVVVGAYYEGSNARGVNGDGGNDLGSSSGAAYIFATSGGIWTQEAYLKASNADTTDNLGGTYYTGGSVAIAGGSVVGGAGGERSGNGDPSDNSLPRSGAAYVWIGFDASLPQLVVEAPDGSIFSNGSSALDFGPLVPGLTGRITLALRNQGVGVLELGAISISGTDATDFHLGAPSASVLSTGETASLDVFFNPAAPGVKLGNLSIANNDPTADPFTLALSGNALNPGAIAQQAYIKASNTAIGDRFGVAVDIDGDTLVVASQEDSAGAGPGADEFNNDAPSAGAVYVYVRSGSGWIQQAYLKSSNPDSTDYFGDSLAISGDTIVVGCRSEDSNATGINGNQTDNSASYSGAAYVFVRNGTTWTQQAYIKASDATAGDQFGFSTAINGDALVVGAPWRLGQTGAAYVFHRSGTTWFEDKILTVAIADSGDQFGRAVSISGDWIAIGAETEDSAATGINGDQADNTAVSSGAAYVYQRSGFDWSLKAYLKSSNSQAGDGFGNALAIDGNTLVVGAIGEDGGASTVDGNQADESVSGAGAAYVFVRDGTLWSQQAYLKPPNPDADDIFGQSLDLSGGVIVVGTNKEDSNATGIDGNAIDNSAAESGATYVFTRSGTTWVLQSYLKTSNSEADDGFGTFYLAINGYVATDAGTVVTGANGEDSIATGINGDQSNNQASRSGAAYVWQLNWDSDGNGFNDSWESVNGFDPSGSDLATQDSDNDGEPDLLEIFQGTSSSSASSGFGVQTPGSATGSETPDGEGTFTVRYRRSRFNTGVSATLRWTSGLDGWFASGQTTDGTTVDITETVVESHPDYEVIEATTTSSGTTPESLFLRLELTPSQ